VGERKRSTIDDVRDMLARSAYGEALELLEVLVAKSPADAEVRALLARTLVHAGQLERAEATCRALIADHPEEVSARVNLGLICLRRGEAGEAAKLLRAIVTDHPDHELAWGYLGVALEVLGRIDEAEAALRSGRHDEAALRMRDRHRTLDASSWTRTPPRLAHLEALRAQAAQTAPEPAKTQPHVFSGAGAPLQRFVETLKPPDFLGEDGASPIVPTRSPASEVPPSALVGQVADPERPELAALLEAALSALVVLPEEAKLGVHPTGLFSVNLRTSDSNGASCVARTAVVYAVLGDIERKALVHSGASFVTLTGTAQVILAPRAGRRLLPLQLNADSAHLRGSQLVAYDGRLLFDTAFVRVTAGKEIPFLHFRGEGFVVLELDRPFVALDVHSTRLLVRQESVVGWIGEFVPERDGTPAVNGEDPFLVLRGEGTVLLNAPAAAPFQDTYTRTPGHP